MNCIFIKKVADTTINNKLVEFDIVNIGNESYIHELKISDKMYNYLAKENEFKGKNSYKNKVVEILNKIVLKVKVNKFKKTLRNIILKNELIGFSLIFAKNIKTDVKNNILLTLNEFVMNEFSHFSTVKENVNKYIEEYKTKNSLNDVNLKLLIISKNVQNVDLDMLEKLNSTYKKTDICTLEKSNKLVLNKIKKINEEYGTCIEILSKSKKDLKEYNVYIFVDSCKSNYVKYKFSKKACFIDFTNNENDKFNEKYIKLEKEIKKGTYYSNKIKELYELYGKITVSMSIVE